MNLGDGILDSGDISTTSGSFLYIDAAQLRSYPTTGTTWTDLSGKSNNISLVNTPTFNSTNGGSLVFNGTNQYATVADNTSLRPTSFSIDVWFRPTSFNTYSGIVTKPATAAAWTPPYLSYMIRLNLTGTQLECSTSTGGTYRQFAVNRTFVANTLYNVTFTFNSATGAAVIYLNGSVLSSQTTTAGAITYAAHPVILGANHGASPVGEYFPGSIYNTRIYNRILSATEVLNNFNTQKSRFGYNGVTTSGSVLFLDASNTLSYPGGTIWNNLAESSTVSGSLISGPTFDTEKGGNIKFDGTDDYVDCNLFVNSITNVTIQCWVNITSTSMKGAFVKVGGGVNGYSIGVGLNTMDSAGNELLGLFSNVRWLDTNTALGTGWKMVNLVLNATSVPSIYLNGALLGSYSGTNPITPTTGTYIGRNIGDESAPPSARAFGGNIANVIIYTRALSASEILANYLSQKSQFD